MTAIVCPNHAGSFDCNPFCELCEGNQEYYECGETIPAGIYFYQTPTAGETRAACSNCDFVSAYWDCPCDLIHECPTN